MMKTVILGQNQIYQGNLLLVNAEYPLCNYMVKGLANADERTPNVLMRRDAANVLQLILKKISAGNKIVPVSGYRSQKEQTEIFNESLRDNGEDFTRKYVALPDHSEHQTGLAIDLGLNQEKIDFIRPDFPYEGICETFRKAAPQYGFIERYGKEKEPVTGISHEPWHFRYVGYPHSKIMTDKQMALEEYIEFIKEYRAESTLVCQQDNGSEIEVYYVPAQKNDTAVEVPETVPYQISGNNVDGFIVTVWGKKDDAKQTICGN